MAVTLTSYAPFDSGAGADVTEETWRNFMKHVLDTGPLANVLNEFELYADSSGMQVKVRSGEAWMQGHWGTKATETTLPIDANSSGGTRTDRAVLRADFVNNRLELDILKGTPGVVAVTQNTSIWEVSLGQISVANGAVTIAAGNITDERLLVVPGGRQPIVWPRVAANAPPGSPGLGGNTTWTVASVVIPDPGWPYYLEVGGALLVGVFTGGNTAMRSIFLQINLDEAAFNPTPSTRIIFRSSGGVDLPSPQIIHLPWSMYRSVLTGSHTVYMLWRNESVPSNFLIYSDNEYYTFGVKVTPAR